MRSSIRKPRFGARLRLRRLPVAVLALLLAVAWSGAALAQNNDAPVTLPGHVLDMLPKAAKLQRTAAAIGVPLILTVMTNWSVPTGSTHFRQSYKHPSARDNH